MLSQFTVKAQKESIPNRVYISLLKKNSSNYFDQCLYALVQYDCVGPTALDVKSMHKSSFPLRVDILPLSFSWQVYTEEWNIF